MAVTPKTTRAKPAGVATTLSAGEALKAAEAAIAPPAKPAPKAAARSKAPAAIVAASTAVDAAPEPIAAAEKAPAAEASPDPSIAPALEAAPEIKPVDIAEGNKIVSDILENSKKFAEDAKAKFETAYAGLNEKAKAGVEKSTKALEEMSDMAKGNVEALVESGKIAAKGIETMGQEAVDYGRKSIEKATASFKSFSTVKTPTEFFQLHSQLISSSFDDFAKEAAKNGEAMLKLAGDIAQPLTARATIVSEKVKSLAA